MPKRSNTGKNSKASEKNEAQKVPYMELVEQDPNFHIGNSKFEFPNGDKYEGGFCAHASGLVWRQGRGAYTTKDGQVYKGEWDGDKLTENSDVEISYPDGTKYFGNLVKSKYSGCGIYQLEADVYLTCDFVENQPMGEITLIDPNRKAWHGFAEKNECLLIQEHPFYRSIGKDLGKGRRKKQPEHAQESKTSIRSSTQSKAKSEVSLKYSDLRDLEKEIFTKSKKTPSDLQLDDSNWYQEYIKYCTTYGPIIAKAKTLGDNFLSDEEYLWYKKYKDFGKKLTTIMKNRKYKNNIKPPTDNRLFRLIHSEEYKVANRPMSVFYPSQEAKEEDCDSNCEC